LQALPIPAGGAFGSYVLSSRVDMPLYLVVLPLLGAFVLAVLFVVVMPPLLWRRWRYEIRPMEVDLQRGLVRVTRTLVPMARVHNTWVPGVDLYSAAWDSPGSSSTRRRVRTKFRN
jgi:membrane protein YdbS with pleckstrin-like domain